MRQGRGRQFLAAAASAVVTASVLAARNRFGAAGSDRWSRKNYRGRTVSLAGGPAVAAGLMTGATASAAWPAAVAATTAAAFGLYDDLAGDSHARGLRGHARAALEGRLTTGLIKLGGLAAGGMAAAAMNARRRPTVRPVVAIDALLIAGMANLLNLLDLRPGRAGKVALAIAAPLAAGRGRGAAVAAASGAATMAVLRTDLCEEVMLGDCGANALGAVIGASMCASLSPRGRVVALSVVVAATLVSERVSFSDVVERTPWLAAIDGIGRQQ